MFAKVNIALFASVLGASVALSGAAHAVVTFDDVEIVPGMTYLENESAGTVHTSAAPGGGFQIEDWDTYTANSNGNPQVQVSSVFDPAKPDPTGSLDSIYVYELIFDFGPPITVTAETYLSGTYLESRQVSDYVLEALFERTDTSAAVNFGEYLIIRFTTSLPVTSAGEFSTNEMIIYGASEIASGVPLPAGVVFLLTGVAGLAGVRRLKSKG